MGSSRQQFPTGWQVLIGLCIVALSYGVRTAVTYPPEEPLAYRLNDCHYQPDSISPITFRYFGVRSFNVMAFNYGKNLWNATAAPGYFQK